MRYSIFIKKDPDRKRWKRVIKIFEKYWNEIDGKSPEGRC
jgi:hypothetical protein